MRSYGQLCAVARALDVVGDRWTLLIVRELLISGPTRFTDLQRGLPGIAPNLLTQRLHELTEHGVIRREPVLPQARARASAYALTDRGRALEGVVRELLKWGAPTVFEAPADATFQMHWLSMPAQFLLADHQPGGADVVVRFGDAADGFDASVSGGAVQVSPVRSEVVPDACVTGPGPTLVAALTGALSVSQAFAAGAQVEGDPAILARLLPQGAPGEGPVTNVVE